MARLDAQARADLARMLAELAGPDRPGTLSQIADLLVEGLPRDHPVRRALVGGRLLAPAVIDWPAITRALLDLSAAPSLSGEDRPHGGVLLDVTRRLLGTAAISEAEVRGLGLDPGDPGLVRLVRADGRHQWPAFQFGPDGDVPAVVRAVNELLGARTGPFGVATGGSAPTAGWGVPRAS
jgi:hypothetical protein